MVWRTHIGSPRPIPPDEFCTDDQAWSGDFWSRRAWRSHFKDEQTMLVGCAATSIGRQSCTNRPGICRSSGWRRAMTFEVDRLYEIGRKSADHRASAIRFQRTSPDDSPIPQMALRWPQSADRRPIPGRCPKVPVDASTTEKNREFVGISLIWPNGAPISDCRRRWPADTLDNPQIIARKCPFWPKDPLERHRSL